MTTIDPAIQAERILNFFQRKCEDLFYLHTRILPAQKTDFIVELNISIKILRPNICIYAFSLV